MFGFSPESVFTFIPESRSPSPRKPVHLEPGIAFSFPGICNDRFVKEWGVTVSAFWETITSLNRMQDDESIRMR